MIGIGTFFVLFFVVPGLAWAAINSEIEDGRRELFDRQDELIREQFHKRLPPPLPKDAD